MKGIAERVGVLEGIVRQPDLSSQSRPGWLVGDKRISPLLKQNKGRYLRITVEVIVAQTTDQTEPLQLAAA